MGCGTWWLSSDTTRRGQRSARQPNLQKRGLLQRRRGSRHPPPGRRRKERGRVERGRTMLRVRQADARHASLLSRSGCRTPHTRAAVRTGRGRCALGCCSYVRACSKSLLHRSADQQRRICWDAELDTLSRVTAGVCNQSAHRV